MSELELEAGEVIRRTALHEKYGGRRQGGISPSSKTSNVFLITASTGEEYGYIYDGWSRIDNAFHYTGEGQVGDQQIAQGNRTIRDHEAEGRDLHVFVAHGVNLEYVGRFRYLDHEQGDARDIHDDERKVIVFRLEQLGGERIGPQRATLDRLGQEPVKEIPVEQILTERMLITGDREPYEAERTEQRLVRAHAEQLEREGHDVCRLQFRPDGEAAPLFCDLFDRTAATIYEAKSTVTRNAMRMAIGQLADYSRLLTPNPRKVVLMPERPRPDLVELAQSQGIEVMWPGRDGYQPADE